MSSRDDGIMGVHTVRIFLSGTSELSSFKKKAQQVAEYFGMSAWMDVDHRAPGSPRAVCLEEVRRCEKFFLFLGANYGEEVLELGLSPTEDEYEQARAAGKPVYVFLEDVPVHDERQAAFRERVGGYASGHWRWTFRTTEEVKALVEEILVAERRTPEWAAPAVPIAPLPRASERWWQTRQRIEQRFPQYAARLCLPEVLPVPILDEAYLAPSSYFIGRENKLLEVVDGLKRRLPTNIYAVHGLGGVGKSELAKQVALRLQAENAFRDGYIWVKLNSHQGTASWDEVALAFDTHLSAIDSSDDKLAILKEILHCVSPLIILDNADDSESLEVASQPLVGKTLLITSRRRTGAERVVDLEDLEPAKAQELYWNIYSGRLGGRISTVREDDRPVLHEIVERLGCHPLSLDIIASKAAERNWSPQRSLADLREHGIRAVVREPGSKLFADERHDNMMKILSLAVEDLRVPGGANYRGRTLFAVCGALCGEYFHFEELEPVLRRFLWLYEEQSKEIEQQRQAAGMAAHDPIRQLMGWEESDAEEPLLEADIRGVNEIRQLLSGDPPLRAVFDRLVALRVVTKHSPRDEVRDQFRLHPLLRDYAWSIMNEHLSPAIWKAVASWAAEKARNLQDQIGDQLQNFRFVLNNVCRNRNLPQEFVTVLSALLPVLRQQGQWGSAIEILGTGAAWLKEQGDKEALAQTVMNLGDLLVRKGDLAGGRYHLEWARTLYLELGRPAQVAWVTYWLSGLVHRNSPSECFVMQARNLRYALENRILDVAVAEIRDIGDLLDEWIDPETWSALHRISLRYGLAQEDVLKIGNGLLHLAFWFCERGDVASTAQVHTWVRSLLELKPSAEHSHYLLRRELRLCLVAGDLTAAETALQQLAASSVRLDRKNHDAEELRAGEAWLLIERGDPPAAAKVLIVAGGLATENDAILNATLLLVCGLLEPGAASDEALDFAVTRLSEANRIETNSVSYALYAGLIAADRLLRKQDGADEILGRFLQALRYLEKTGSVWHCWLARLEPRVVQKAGLAKLQQLWLEGDRPSPPAPVVVLPRDLPPVVRSRRDGRLMRLVPAGLCVHEDKRLGEPGAVWLPPYYMDIDLVSRNDFLRFSEATGRPLPAGWQPEEVGDGPATNLTHAEAAAYCIWAGKVLPHVYELQRATFLDVDDPARGRWLEEITLQEIGPAVESVLTKLRNAQEKPPATLWGQGAAGQRNSRSEADRPGLVFAEALPPEVTAAQVLGCERPTEQAVHLVHLLASSLFLTVAEKEQILPAIPHLGRESIDRITWLLENEYVVLGALDTRSDPRVRALTELRAREWRVLVDRQLGREPQEEVDPGEQEFCDRCDPFAYAPPSDILFPRGLDLKECLADELSAAQRPSALLFLERLATTAALTRDEKRSALAALTRGVAALGELVTAWQAIAEERRTAAAAKELFTQNLVRLQKAWQEWEELAGEFERIAQGPEKLFAGQQLLFQEPTNPYQKLSAWDMPLQQPGDPAALLPAHPLLSFDEHRFLSLLSQSISLTRGEKRSILKAVERLSQEQIDGLTHILEEERQKFCELPQQHWNQLTAIHQKHWVEWTSLLAELQGVEAMVEATEVVVPAFDEGETRDNDVNISNLDYSWLEGPFSPEFNGNPFAQQPPCDIFLPTGVDIRSIIPEHPKIFFAEKRFLQALSGSISLTADEKQRIIQAIPRLTQGQIDGLVKILLEERRRFLELEPSHWRQLQAVCEEYWSYWPDLVHNVLPGLPELHLPTDGSFHRLDGSIWHWTSTVDPKDGARWIAGGPEMSMADNPVRFSLRREADPRGEGRSRLRGFRGAVPIVTPEDLQDLVPVDPAIA